MKRYKGISPLVFLLATVVAPTLCKASDNAWQRFSRPDKYLDEEYAFLPSQWAYSTSYTWSQTSIQMDLNIVNAANGEKSKLSLISENSSLQKPGFRVGFGSLRFGISREMGPSKKKNDTYSLSFLSSAYGLQASYSRLYQMVAAQLTFPATGTGNTINSEYPGKLRKVKIDGYYSFNKSKFSYLAAYDAKVIQRKTVGSFICTANYLQSDYIIDSRDEALIDMLHGIRQGSTNQGAVGVGYSMNFVPYHRDAASQRKIRSLRNLTVNLTAVPTLTLFSRMNYGYADGQKYKISGRYQPNLMTRGAICFTYGHFWVNGFVDSNFYRYKNTSKPLEITDGDNTYKITGKGLFNYWKAGFSLNIRF